jgi:hypothetical protein
MKLVDYFTAAHFVATQASHRRSPAHQLVTSIGAPARIHLMLRSEAKSSSGAAPDILGSYNYNNLSLDTISLLAVFCANKHYSARKHKIRQKRAGF